MKRIRKEKEARITSGENGTDGELTKLGVIRVEKSDWGLHINKRRRVVRSRKQKKKKKTHKPPKKPLKLTPKG